MESGRDCGANACPLTARWVKSVVFVDDVRRALQPYGHQQCNAEVCAGVLNDTDTDADAVSPTLPANPDGPHLAPRFARSVPNLSTNIGTVTFRYQN